jgi:hypothetical protein
MSDLTRRGFVTTSAGAAASMTVLGALVTEMADAQEDAKTPHHPVVAYIKNPRSGEISVMSGDRTVKVHDRKLAARLARAAR